MKRLSRCVLKLLLVGAFGILSIKAEEIRPVESKPVRIDGLDISVVTQAVWEPGPKGQRRDVVLQLHIKNAGEKDAVFKTFANFVPLIRRSDGEWQEIGLGAVILLVPPDIRLAQGKEIRLSLDASIGILPNDNPRSDRLFYGDRTGARGSASLKDGAYELKFAIGTSGDLHLGEAPDPRGPVPKMTEPVGFKFVPAK